MRALRLFLLLAAAAAVLGQGENEPYFALSSSRTFGSNGNPTVAFSAWNIDSLEFRVYRVNDPLEFFQQLENPRHFGGRAAPPPRERTALERIRAWKRSVRANIRRSLRAQFTESPGARFEGMFPRQSRAVSKEIRYAEAPLLNSSQLVLTFQQPVRSRTRWETHSVEVGVKDRGVYLVEAVRGELRAYTILIVTDIVMITKGGRSRLVNLVVDRKTGQPLPGIKLAALTREGSAAEGETGGDGVCEIRPRAGITGDLRLVARRERDFAVNIVPGGLANSIEQWMGYIYTDRPVYRPGHTVHLKGILRLRSAAGYSVPAGRNVAVDIQDPEQKPVFQKTLTASANGTIHADLELGPGAALGHYFIGVKSGEDFMSGSFEVEEYKKPEYEVRVSAAKARVLQGESVPVTIDARYYFGEPVSGAKVKYAVYRDRYWFPLWYDPDDEQVEASPGGEGSDEGGDQENEQEGKLDADGKLTVNVATSVSDRRHDYRYRIEARVTDAANREITGRTWVIATYGSFALNVAPERYFYAPGAQARFTVQARTYDNKPVSAHARLELLKWNYRDEEKSEVKGAAEVDIDAAGSGTALLDIPAEGGSYRVRTRARTPEAREVEAYAWLWISGGARWDMERQERGVQIISDKKSYRAGETVKLLIVAGQPNTPVYLTLEGRELRQYKLLRSSESTVSYELPVTANDEPGITVNAAYIRDGVFYNGSKYVRIPPVEHQLNVKLATDKPQYLPGQTAEYSIEVSGADGRPVPRAEFSLGVVDEAIYGIRRDFTQDILTFFFDREWNRVFTDTSLEYYFSGEAGKRRMRLAELRPASRLAQLKPERLVQPKIRKAFPDTAFWAAGLVTDSAGRARAKVEFPDSLTTWRATARGATPETKVGNATLKTVVRKNLILRLAVPRFFVRGDEVTISALVHNYLAEAKTVRVSLDVAGLEVLEGSGRDMQVPSRGEIKVDWRVRAKAVRTAKLTAKALTNEESDGLELELPVNVPGVKLSQARGGSLAAGASAAFDLTFPAQVEPGSRSLAIRVSPSVAGSLFGALDYLTSFPYGCVEQTMSSFLPNVIVRQVVRDLGLKADLNDAALQEKIRAGLDRLYNFQHEDGGWGWWEADESHPFMTAYVVAGLVQAQSAGVPVNARAVQRGAAWVQKDLAADARLAPDLRAYMAYALVAAGQSTPALGQVYERRSRLSPYGLALLGLALEQTRDGRAAQIAAALEQAAQQDEEQAWWTADRDELLDFPNDVTPEATAFAARFLARQRRDSTLLPKAALWLMNHRNEGYWWSSTKQTAMVIYGLADYLKATNELNPDLTATVLVNDQPVLSRKIDRATGLVPPDLVLDESKLQAGVNHIRITTSGQGRLYYSVRQEYFSSEKRLQEAGTVSLNLLRDHFRLVPAKDGGRIVYDTVPLTGPAAPGDLLAVRLTVTGSEWKYMMIEDPIPAGTEFVERDSVYELRNRPPWWEYAFTRRELHDDRMALFQTWFPRGQQQYFYVLKVVNPGVFQASPARVQPMYQPGVMATTEAFRLEVK